MFHTFLFAFVIVGTANALPETFRVVNGTDAEEGEFPFAASLRYAPGFHTCGCSILSEKWILTAAHCVANYKDKPSTYNVQYGGTVISENGTQVANVTKIIVHENYHPEKNLVNDIAILLLETPIKFSDNVKPVALPKQSYEVPENSTATLVGWGYEKENGVVQDRLQKVDLITVSDEYCNKLFKGYTHKSQICAGVPEGGKGQCNGDSGGPLIVNGEQVGIVSFSVHPCTIAPYPGVYTKVSHFVDWIMERRQFAAQCKANYAAL